MKIFQGQINQLNLGKIQGKLYDTFNIDLSYDEGKVSISPRTIMTTDSLSNMTTPVGFKYFDGHWFTPAGRMFMNDGTAKGAFYQDTSTGAPTTTINSLYSDIEVFGDVLLVSTTDQLWSKAANAGTGTGSYTSRRTFAVSGDSPAHMLCVYNNRAYWVDTRGQIYSMNTSFTSAVTTNTTYTFKVPDGLDVTWMRSDSSGIFIGTMDRNSGNCWVYKWDGVTADRWMARYPIPAQGVLAGHIPADGSLRIMTTQAELMQFTGSGFTTEGRLPIKRNLLYKANGIIFNDRFIHPNGMCEIDGKLSMLINNRNNSTTSATYETNIHSGIWESDGQSLNHKYSLSFSNGTITDYGQINVNSVGGLANVADRYDVTDANKGNFLAGASYYSTSSISTGIGYGIWTDDYFDTLEKSGYFSTVEIMSNHLTDSYGQMGLITTPSQSFRFDMKYRTKYPVSGIFDLTWTSPKTFTTSDTNIAKGHEITILQGKGAGRIAHVLSVSGGTVTLDQDIQNAAGTARGRYENWTWIGKTGDPNIPDSMKSIGSPGTRIELKVSMIATGEATVDEMILDNTKQK